MAIVLAAGLLIAIFVKITPVDNGSEPQRVGDIIWYSAPDGGVGFRILKVDHPKYKIKIMMKSPDTVYYEGIFEYQGEKLDSIELSDLGSYFGENIHLTNGEEMQPVSD